MGYQRWRRSSHEGTAVNLALEDDLLVERERGVVREMRVVPMRVSRWRHQWDAHNKGVLWVTPQAK